MVEMITNSAPPEVVVSTRGDVQDAARTYAARKIERLVTQVRGPVLFARVELTVHDDPARERPAFAKAELDVNGRMARAHAAAATMVEAVDELDRRLRERLERVSRHEADKHRRFRGEHEWRHAEYSPPRPAFFPRPVDERAIVRHKTFAWGEMTPEEAVVDLEALDHDFYLFTNIETGEDNVVARTASGYELHEPSATCSLHASTPITRSPVRPTVATTDEAREILDLTDRPFVFFLDPDDGRGRVLYRRYDGHYGLIVPSTGS